MTLSKIKQETSKRILFLNKKIEELNILEMDIDKKVRLEVKYKEEREILNYAIHELNKY